MKFKNIFFVILFMALAFSCKKKQTIDEITAEKFKGEWLSTSILINGNEIVSIDSFIVVTTYFDIDLNFGRYNKKSYQADSILNEIEGNFFINNNGTTIGYIKDGLATPYYLSIKTLTDKILATEGTNENGVNEVYSGVKK